MTTSFSIKLFDLASGIANGLVATGRVLALQQHPFEFRLAKETTTVISHNHSTML